jgi:hypothetical protein
MIERTEYFLPFEHFPWFRDATIGQLTNVQLPNTHHLYWPDLDIDLAVESLAHPERYPLVSSRGTKQTPKRASKRIRH